MAIEFSFEKSLLVLEHVFFLNIKLFLFYQLPELNFLIIQELIFFEYIPLI